MAENAVSTAKTPIETNSDLIAEVQSLVDNLPEAGGDGGVVDMIIADFTTLEEVSTYDVPLTSEQIEAIGTADEIYCYVSFTKPTEQDGRGTCKIGVYQNYYFALALFGNEASHKNVTPSSAAFGGDFVSVIAKFNRASNAFLQITSVFKSGDTQYANSVATMYSLFLPNMIESAIMRFQTSTVFGIGTTAKIIARRYI